MFKPSAHISKVANGFTVELKSPSQNPTDQFDHRYEEYIFSTYEEAQAKVHAYFNPF